MKLLGESFKGFNKLKNLSLNLADFNFDWDTSESEDEGEGVKIHFHILGEGLKALNGLESLSL